MIPMWAALLVLCAALSASPARAEGLGGSTGGIDGLTQQVTGQGMAAPKPPSGPSLAISGPASGLVNAASTNFTVTLTGTTFSGSQTVTIADGGQGGTVTPSIGTLGVTPKTVTPAVSATGFTFTYTPVVAGNITLTITNAQGWTNPLPVTYTSVGACTNKLDFSVACNSQYLAMGLP